jgi:hypothetical protein
MINRGSREITAPAKTIIMKKTSFDRSIALPSCRKPSHPRCVPGQLAMSALMLARFQLLLCNLGPHVHARVQRQHIQQSDKSSI